VQVRKRRFPSLALLGVRYGCVYELAPPAAATAAGDATEGSAAADGGDASASNDAAGDAADAAGGAKRGGGRGRGRGRGRGGRAGGGAGYALHLVPDGVLMPPLKARDVLGDAPSGAGAGGESGDSGDEGEDRDPALPGPVDNRHLVDSGTAQELSAGDIARMKAEGATGVSIIAALAGNSATFAGKTAFSQEKYLRKKAAKRVPLGGGGGVGVRTPPAATPSWHQRLWSLTPRVFGVVMWRVVWRGVGRRYIIRFRVLQPNPMLIVEALVDKEADNMWCV
jgi:hypothetical protein